MNTLKYIWRYFKKVWQYRRALEVIRPYQVKNMASGIRSVLIDLHTDGVEDYAGRYFYLLAYYFSFNHDIIYLTYDSTDIIRSFPSQNYKKAAFDLFNMRIVQYTDQVDISSLTTWVTDSIPHIPLHLSPEVKRIKLSFGYDLAEQPFDDIVPFTFHPNFLAGRQKVDRQIIVNLRDRSTRLFRVAFFGNLDEQTYTVNSLDAYWKEKVKARAAIISFLKQQYSEEQLKLVLTKAEWEKEKTKTANILIGSTVVDSKEWFETLSKAHFFLALPGVKMPWCHNLIESLACGTIPIVQKHKELYLPFEDGKNAFLFESMEQLAQKLDIIMEMSESNIQTMRLAVIDLYDQYLSPEHFANKVLSQSINKIHHLHFPYIKGERYMY